MSDTIGSISANSSASASARKTGSTLDQDAFLKLLVTKLSNQDPLNPTGDTEFIAQLAQFTSLSEMSSVNSSTSLSAAFNLIGKTVVGLDGNDSPVAGKVDSITSSSGKIALNIGNRSVALSDVQQVLSDTKSSTGDTSSTGNTSSTVSTDSSTSSK